MVSVANVSYTAYYWQQQEEAPLKFIYFCNPDMNSRPGHTPSVWGVFDTCHARDEYSPCDACHAHSELFGARSQNGGKCEESQCAMCVARAAIRSKISVPPLMPLRLFSAFTTLLRNRQFSTQSACANVCMALR